MPPTDSDHPESVPPRLAEALRSLSSGGDAAEPSPTVDAVILERARAHFESGSATARRRGWRPLVAAAAAVWIGIGTGFAFRFARGRLDRDPGQTHVVRTGPGPDRGLDLDGNGRVDVRDALGLAAAVRDATPLDPRWDLTGDGRLDSADVDALLAEVTKL